MYLPRLCSSRSSVATDDLRGVSRRPGPKNHGRCIPLTSLESRRKGELEVAASRPRMRTFNCLKEHRSLESNQLPPVQNIEESPALLGPGNGVTFLTCNDPKPDSNRTSVCAVRHRIPLQARRCAHVWTRNEVGVQVGEPPRPNYCERSSSTTHPGDCELNAGVHGRRGLNEHRVNLNLEPTATGFSPVQPSGATSVEISVNIVGFELAAEERKGGKTHRIRNYDPAQDQPGAVPVFASGIPMLSRYPTKWTNLYHASAKGAERSYQTNLRSWCKGSGGLSTSIKEKILNQAEVSSNRLNDESGKESIHVLEVEGELTVSADGVVYLWCLWIAPRGEVVEDTKTLKGLPAAHSPRMYDTTPLPRIVHKAPRDEASPTMRRRKDGSFALRSSKKKGEAMNEERDAPNPYHVPSSSLPRAALVLPQPNAI
ncbi:hypothetical protein C8R46DRAFT_1027856 [Mycena filopes]|nr:hypothetical protein C8R46DRAFT_1027856 [Mycena filopes]